MYLLARFGNNRSYRNEDINSYINSYMGALEKTEITASIHHIAICLKSGIPIYNSEVLGTAGRKMRRKKTQAIAKHYEFSRKCNKKYPFLLRNEFIY